MDIELEATSIIVESSYGDVRVELLNINEQKFIDELLDIVSKLSFDESETRSIIEGLGFDTVKEIVNE